MSGPDDQ
jgi:hypothetical protein